MGDKLMSLLAIMQNPFAEDVELIIRVEKNGLLDGEVLYDGDLIICANKKQFIQEVLEQLDDEASILLEHWERKDA